MMKTLTEKRFFYWVEDDISVTLRSRSGSYGGGKRGTRYLLYQDKVGALCQDDYKGVMLVIVAKEKDNGNSSEKTYTA